MREIKISLTLVFMFIFTVCAQANWETRLQRSIEQDRQQARLNVEGTRSQNVNRSSRAPIDYNRQDISRPQNLASTQIQTSFPVILSDPRYFGDYCTRKNKRKIVSSPGPFSDIMQWFDNDLSTYQQWYADHAASLAQTPYALDNAHFMWQDALSLNYDQGHLRSVTLSEAFKEYLDVRSNPLPINKARAYQSGIYYYTGNQQTAALNFAVDQGILSGFISRIIESRYNPSTEKVDVCWEGIAFRSQLLFYNQ